MFERVRKQYARFLLAKAVRLLNRAIALSIYPHPSKSNFIETRFRVINHVEKNVRNTTVA